MLYVVLLKVITTVFALCHLVVNAADANDSLVQVFDTAASQFIYTDSPQVVVFGTGLDNVGIELHWSNRLIENENYTITSRTPNNITLSLMAGSHWRSDVDQLPAPLTLLAVSHEGEYVSVNPVDPDAGRDVAMVFEQLTVNANEELHIFATLTRELRFTGTGFFAPTLGYKMLLGFNSDIYEGRDYLIQWISHTEINLLLQGSYTWSFAGRAAPLVVTHINPLGQMNGWVKLPNGGVTVAQVEEDNSNPPDDPADITVDQSSIAYIYQSTSMQSIVLHGTGFSNDMALTLDPPLRQGHDFTLVYQRWGQVELRLGYFAKWRSSPGALVLKHIHTHNREQDIGGEYGLLIAVVFADPDVFSSATAIHNTQSKLFTIRGYGFTQSPHMHVTLRHVSDYDHDVIKVTENTIQFQLHPHKSWTSDFMIGINDGRFPLEVDVYNTGGGEIFPPHTITVGYVVADKPYVTCDDSCRFAFDGVCDDMTQKLFAQHHQAPDTGVPSCANYTDCTDCGGVDVVVGPQCANTCPHARDGVCDYPWMAKHCDFGTDCDDCGPLNAHGNYTVDIAPVVHTALEDTSQTQLIYNDALSLKISGVVADPTGQFLRWSNSLLDDHVGYVVNATAHTIAVHKHTAIPWMESGQTLPAVLSVTAVREPSLTVDPDSTFTQVDVPIAIVFEALAVSASSVQLSATQSRELYVTGTGFPTSPDEYSLQLEFSPPLEQGVDYTVRLNTRTDLWVVLGEGRSWRSYPGPLLVTAANTLGTEDGWLAQGDDGVGVTVALVHRDPVTNPHSEAPSPLMRAAGGLLMFLVFVPMFVFVFCLVSAAFRRRQQQAARTGLNASEFELTRAKPMSVTAADIIMNNSNNGEGEGDMHESSYTIVPEGQQYEYDEV